MKGITTDVCVPISRLADCIEETMSDIEPLPFPAPIVGHVGDGNFHCLLVVDVESETEMRAAKDFSARLVERALRMGGTCTGEHGVGHGKLAYMEQEHDAASLAMMRTLKQALDPEGLMNPGKLIPGVGEPLTV
jgi:D-lactate dehydrogenase (cytochrome)